jgi:hypothetical protein
MADLHAQLTKPPERMQQISGNMGDLGRAFCPPLCADMGAIPTHSGSAFILHDEGPADGGRLRVLLEQSLTYTLMVPCARIDAALDCRAYATDRKGEAPTIGLLGGRNRGSLNHTHDAARRSTLGRRSPTSIQTTHTQPTWRGDVGSGIALVEPDAPEDDSPRCCTVGVNSRGGSSTGV